MEPDRVSDWGQTSFTGSGIAETGAPQILRGRRGYEGNWELPTKESNAILKCEELYSCLQAPGFANTLI